MVVWPFGSQLITRFLRYMSPSSCIFLKTVRTAMVRFSSRVYASRDQSSDDPRARSCFRIFVLLSSAKAFTLSRKASRPRSCRRLPSSLSNFFSTTVWVAMAAWSVPGIQSVRRPAMRFLRTYISWMVHIIEEPR